MNLYLEHWQGIDASARERFARQLAKELPLGFAFYAVHSYQLGKQQCDVALFRRGDATFAFIPGGLVTIGYDPTRSWQPNPDELASWQTSAAEYGITHSLSEHIAAATLSPRQIDVAPFLIETVAHEVGWEPVANSELEHFDTLPGDGAQITRSRKVDDGAVVVERGRMQTHAELAAELQAAGFRFPTSAEWEYCCGAGARTLFRWGDHVPCDHYPTDTNATGWTLHRRPNAFGLHIAADPYKNELVAEIGTTRGGDGGGTICGGAGFFLGWLTLATAYFEEHACRHDPDEPVPAGYRIGRRVLELR